jgi:hypothetical protein
MAPRSDLRATLRPKGSVSAGRNDAFRPAYTAPFNGPGAALLRTNGILFPYTPNISVSHQVEYSQYDLVHTNYQQNAFNKSRNPAIQVTGTFVSQTPEEAAYTVGVMHFLRIVSKMNFGASDTEAGTPPPVLEFSAYGTYNFRRVPVVMGSFQFVYEDNVDYVEVSVGNGELVQVPSLMLISMDLLPQYSPALQNKFNLNELAAGGGYMKGFL